MGGKKPLRRPLWPPTRATASNYYPLGLDGAGGAAKPLLRAPKKPAPLHGRLPAFSGAVDAFERARKCFLEWRYFFSIILSEFLKNRVALHLFSQYCSENFGTELKSVRKSERYQSLPICVLDCVYSLRTKYYAVTVPVLQRYADTYMGGNLYAGQDTLSDFITHIKEFSDCSEFAKTVLKNNQVLSGRNKAEVCYEIATKLHELLNMDTFDDFRNFEKEALLEIVLRSVRGMGDAGVNNMFMMAGDPNRCKPDVHIHRCIKNALGTDVPNNECQILFRETVKKLKDSGYPDLTVRNLDSVIWNKYQKNRSIF